MKKIVHILTFLLISFQAIAQTFPVQLTPQTIPPYPVYISDYANPNITVDKVKLQIVLNDLTSSNREVRLKVFIEGQGVLAQSTDMVIGAQPIFIDGGIPLQLGSIDLAPYFEFQNLQGINPNVYGSALQEGIYKFCFEVYDVFTGNQLSQKTCTSFVLFQNEPPFLNLPYNESVIQEQNPLNIVFQWTPRHVNVSNVQYEFSLVEIWDNYVDPQAAFLSSPPIFQTTTTQTTLIYGLAYPQLLAGKRYAWRVRAFATQGAEEIGVFTNQGYSEIFWFSYQTQCDAPTFVNTDEIGDQHAKIIWQGDLSSHLDYTIKYREKNSGSNWYELTTPREYITISDLNRETTYEYKIVSNCDFGSYGETLIYEFTTLSEQASSYIGCNIEPDPVDLSNQTLLTELYANDIFTAGDFPVTVLQLSNATSPFSGSGYTVVPWLGDTKIAVAFNSIQINTDMKLVAGEVKTTYDAEWGDVDFVDDLFEIFEGDNDAQEVEIDFNIDIEDISVDPDNNGEITITDPETGVQITIPGGDDVTIIDENGDVFHVDEDGNVTEGGEIAEGGPIDTNNSNGFDSGGNITQLTAQGIKVVFKDDLSYAYGFDKIPSGQEDNLSSYYESIIDADGSAYHIIHKAIENGGNDILKADIIGTTDTAVLDRLVFKNAQGVKIDHTISDSEVILNLSGHFSFENENIYATLLPEQEGGQQTIAGVFKLWHLSQEEVNVKVVSVNGASLPNNIEGNLNSIFGKAVVSFNVTTGAIEVDASLYGGDNLLVGDSALLANYTDEERAIINHFKTQEYDVNQYYLFVFGNDIQPSRSISGFMPLKRQFGFIFSNPNATEEGKTNQVEVMAHELGHGIFGLEHPFKQLGTDQGATDWLMDYSNGNRLNHMEWAQIHNPDFQLYLFQDDEDGEYQSYQYMNGYNVVPDAFVSYLQNYSGESISFISATGKVFSIPSNAKDVTFKSNGTLSAFTLNENGQEVRYVGLVLKQGAPDESFVGYGRETGTTSTWQERVYKDYFSKDLGSETNVFLGTKTNNPCGINLFTKTYPVNVSPPWNSGGNGDELNSNNFISGLTPIVTNINSPYTCNVCTSGTEFINSYSEIDDVDAQDKITEIAHLMCSDDLFASFYAEFSNEGYNNLLAWQQSYYDAGEGDISAEAFSRFQEAYKAYIEYFNEASSFIDESNFEDKEAILGIAYNFGSAQLAGLTVEQKLKMLQIISSGTMSGYWASGSYNRESLALRIIESVTDTQASDFINGLTDEMYKANDKLLYVNLYNKIDNFFSQDNFTSLILKFTELARTAKGITGINETNIEEITEARFWWDVTNEQFLWIFNKVNDNSDITVNYTDPTSIVFKQGCKTYTLNNQGEYANYICTDYIVDETLNPFDLISLSIINDITFTQENSGKYGVTIGTKENVVPAVFLMFLNTNKNNAIATNIATNALTVASIYYSGAEIALYRAGTATTAKLFYACADLFVTFTDPYFSSPSFINHTKGVIVDVFGVEQQQAEEFANALQISWTIGSTVLTIDTASNIPNPQKNIEALANYKALVNKVGPEDAKRIISAEEALADKTIEGFNKLERKILEDVSLKNQLDDEIINAERRINNLRFSSYAGTIINNQNNILDEIESIAGEFKAFNYPINGSPEVVDQITQQRAGTFWNMGANVNISQYFSIDAKFYVKIENNVENGRLLFFDVNENKCLGWGLLPDGISLDTPTDYENLITDLMRVHGYSTVNNVDFGSIKGTLNLSATKSNAILGSYYATASELGTKDVLDRFNVYKNYAFTNKNSSLKPGSIFMLNLPDGVYVPSTFFEKFNKPFLDYLIENKNQLEIIFTTNPNIQEVLIKYGTPDLPSGYASEIRYLRERGISEIKFKDGTLLNLNEIDLDFLDWSDWQY